MHTLMPIGGAINHENPDIMREFIRRAGGSAARIVILPQASAEAGTGAGYVKQFKELGAGEVLILECPSREQAGTPAQIEMLQVASAIFITGGTQMRISSLFGGTPVEAALLEAYQRGCLVGGTSAGASILSKTMIAYGQGGPTPRERMVQFVPGLGFTDRFIFDQHFRQRDRLGRLIYAVAAYPGAIGVGIDENTTAVGEDDNLITVLGSGAVTIVDGSQISATDVAEVTRRKPVAVAGLTVHVLTPGSSFERLTRKAELPALLLEE